MPKYTTASNSPAANYGANAGTKYSYEVNFGVLDPLQTNPLRGYTVANHPSALKRARQNEKRRMRNKSVRTKVRGAIKSVRDAVEAKDTDTAGSALGKATVVIDKAASKGVLHRRTASRTISRLSRQVNTIGQ